MDGDDWFSEEKELCMKLTLVSKPGKLLSGLWKFRVLLIIEKESMGSVLKSSFIGFRLLMTLLFLLLLLLHWLSMIIFSDEF